MKLHCSLQNVPSAAVSWPRISCFSSPAGSIIRCWVLKILDQTMRLPKDSAFWKPSPMFRSATFGWLDLDRWKGVMVLVGWLSCIFLRFPLLAACSFMGCLFCNATSSRSFILYLNSVQVNKTKITHCSWKSKRTCKSGMKLLSETWLLLCQVVPLALLSINWKSSARNCSTSPDCLGQDWVQTWTVDFCFELKFQGGSMEGELYVGFNTNTYIRRATATVVPVVSNCNNCHFM